MFSKIRPVGSQVPKPEPASSISLPWAKHYVTLFTRSGTEALSLAVRAAIKQKPEVRAPEVIIPAYGCPDLIAAVNAQGARAVLVDFVENLPFMDKEGVLSAITPQTVAVVGVDFLGSPERISLLSGICSERSVVMIEDSAQSFPPFTSKDGLADFAILSFGRGKPINFMGGGALLVRKSHQSVLDQFNVEYSSTTLRLNFVWHLKRLFFRLLMTRYFYPILERIPFLHVGETRFQPLTSISLLEIPPSLLAGGLRAYTERRSLNSLYNEKLDFLLQLGWRQPVVGSSEQSSQRLRYALLAPSEAWRDRALRELNRQGIGANAFYGNALPDIMAPEAADIRLMGGYTNAREFSRRLLVLPTHEDVNENDVSRIVDTFKRLVS